jgi:signal transduction histidine kinase
LLVSNVNESALREIVGAADLPRVRELGIRSGVVVPLQARGRTIGTMVFFSSAPDRRFDARDQALAEEIARRAAVAIDAARLYREAQEAIQLRDEFLRVASHELRTPLASLLMSLQWLHRKVDAKSPVEAETLAKQLDNNIRQGQRLRRLVDDLLATTRFGGGLLELNRSEVDLGELVREVVERFEFDLNRAKCEVSLEVVAPVRGSWDASRLDQVVSNLLSNALKFGPGLPIEIAVSHKGTYAELSVTDHGIGIDPARLDTIFGRFTRGVSSTQYGGLGLGLYVSRQIVEQHGGTISVRSQLGKGSTFTVKLPIGG